MKLYAPKYYERFACIADRCKHSCCIGWEIDVDDDTYEKYQSLQGGYGETIKESIDSTDTPHFRLCEGDRCPHLNEKGLCNIILNLGEDCLCSICHLHPRFFNYTSRGKEVGLGLSCEEACRIILSSDDYADMICLGNIDEDDEDFIGGFDPQTHRQRLFSILSDPSLPYSEKIKTIEEEYRISLSSIPDENMLKALDSLEYLNEDDRALFSLYSAASVADFSFEKECERALAYFIYRHCAEAYCLNDLRSSLGFALFAERLLRSISAAKNAEDFEELCSLARIISEEIEYSEDNTESIKLELDFWINEDV